MRHLISLAGALLAAGLAAPSATAQSVTVADWAEKPSVDQVANAYPKMPLLLSLEGSATLSCQVTAGGILENCAVVDESPKELGFGNAALSLTPFFRLRPEIRDGRPAVSDVRIPIRFLMPEPLPLVQPGPPTSPGALKLAKELVRIDGRPDTFRQFYAMKGQLLEYTRTPGASIEVRRTASAATRGAAEARLDEILDSMAATYASLLSEAELADLLRNARSEHPAFFIKQNRALSEVDANLNQEFSLRMRIAARAGLCERRACTPDRDFGLARQGDTPRKITIALPIWLEQPTLDQIENARPPLAKLVGIEGRVQMACGIAPLGIADTCAVTEESPKGLGFGAAALSLRGYFRLSPAMMQRDAGDVALAQIRFPRPTSLFPPMDEPKPAALGALALARAYVKAVQTDTRREQFALAERTFDSMKLEGVDPGDRTAMRGILMAAAAHAASELDDFTARTYAALLSEDELRSALALLDTAGGRALMAHRQELTFAMMGAVQAYDSVIAADAGHAFCKVRGCAGPKPGSLRPPPKSRKS